MLQVHASRASDPRVAAEEKKQQRHSLRSDGLYLAGAGAVVAGLAMNHGGSRAMIAAGCFALVFPASELVMGFIRGLRK